MKKLIFLISLHSILAFSQDKVIYGSDNRYEVFEESNPARIELARSTAAKIPNMLIRLAGKEYYMRTITLTDHGVCSTERFSHQLANAYCTGFLVGPDTLVTAGHCVTNLKDCQSSKWVFDYKVETHEQTKILLPKDNVYNCKSIIAQKYDVKPGFDYAVIKLDHKVKGRTPLSFRKSGVISPGTPVFTIGHPSGLPTKIADGANVRSIGEHWFTSNLDTFAGNSGSPVFNALTNEVEGILVRGDVDYVMDETRGCQVPNICTDDGCSGEDASFITDVPIK